MTIHKVRKSVGSYSQESTGFNIFNDADRTDFRKFFNEATLKTIEGIANEPHLAALEISILAQVGADVHQHRVELTEDYFTDQLTTIHNSTYAEATDTFTLLNDWVEGPVFEVTRPNGVGRCTAYAKGNEILRIDNDEVK